jgi:uncharacterized protein YdeI (YjbR/CyaY-like superfamily)
VDAIFFYSPGDLRRWLEQNHDTATELLVGFNKKASGRGGITWAEAVDEALCFGWIDGVRPSGDEHSYAIRFTPRRRGSMWSARNVERVEALAKEGRINPAGLAAFDARDRSRKPYRTTDELPLSAELEKRFRGNARAWRFFSEQAPSYRRNASRWVMSAKREETRERRLARLVEDSAAGRRLRQLGG